MGKPLAGYPHAIGAKWESVWDHTGPSSYTQVSTGSPPTGGDSVTAAEAGMSFFDSVEVVGGDNGEYGGVAFVDGGQNGVSDTATLLWNVSHTGAEVSAATNLSARTLRLRAIGY